MGNSLYRFRTINDNSISGLMNDNIFGSTPDAFNDPYDSLFQYDVDKIYELLINDNRTFVLLSEELLEEIRKEKKDVKIEEIYELVKNKTLFLPQINNYALKVLFAIRRQLFVTCFCKSVTKEIMWSHYANYGKGFAIEYDEDDIKKMAKYYLEKYTQDYKEDYLDVDLFDLFGLEAVDYNSSRLDGTELAYKKIKELLENNFLYRQGRITGSKFSLDKKTFNQIVLHKDKSWEYETEIRLITPNHSIEAQFGLVGSIKPKAIYLGEFIDFNNEYTICSIAKNKAIPIYKMISSLDKKRFGLKKRKINDNELSRILEKFESVNFYE